MNEILKEMGFNSLDDQVFKLVDFEYKGYFCQVVRFEISKRHITLKQLQEEIDSFIDTGMLEEIATRMAIIGFNGYVFVPCNDNYINKLSNPESYDDWDIECNGGLTFATTANNNKGVKCYKIGFDCLHTQDYSTPFCEDYLDKRDHFEDMNLWNIDKVKNETKRIVDQIQ